MRDNGSGLAPPWLPPGDISAWPAPGRAGGNRDVPGIQTAAKLAALPRQGGNLKKAVAAITIESYEAEPARGRRGTWVA